MRPRFAIWFAVASVVIVAACQPGSTSPTGTARPSESAPQRAEPSIPEAGAHIDPGLVTRPALTCGDNERLFPPEALEGPGFAELGLDPAAGVLRSTIADLSDELPDSGWHRVHEDPQGVTFVARGNAETPWFTVTVAPFDGGLQPVIMGECTLAIAAPTGLTFASWWLDPDGPPLAPGTTEVRILLREQACASGKPPDGRVMPPTILMHPDSIEVLIAIRITPGGAECPGNPAYSMKLALPEPIGSRHLFDASQFPPRPVTTEDPG